MKQLIYEGTNLNETQLILSDKQLKTTNWIEEDEFIYNDTLYDVISKTKTGEDLSLIVIADINEGNILQNIIGTTTRHLPLHKIMTSLFELLNIYNYGSALSIKFTAYSSASEKPITYKLVLPNSALEIPVRPPKALH